MEKNSTPPKGNTKQQIIDAAVELFYIHGIHWVSFKQIADKVEISQPAIYKHFTDKDDLVAACIQNAAQSGRTSIDLLVSQQTTPPKKISAYLEGNLLWMDQNRPKGLMLLAMYYFSHVNPSLKEILFLIHKSSVARVKAQIDHGNEKKRWQISNSEHLASTIHDLLIGQMFKAYYEPHEMPIETRIKLLNKVVASLIKAYSTL